MICGVSANITTLALRLGKARQWLTKRPKRPVSSVASTLYLKMINNSK